MNFNKNKLINAVLRNYYNTFSFTLDTNDFVPQKFNKKIHNYIYKNMKKKFKEIDKEDKKYQQTFKKKQKLKLKQKIQIEDKPISKLVLFFKSLLKRKKRSEFVKEKADYFCETKIDECDSTSALDNETSEINSCITNPEQ